MPGKRNEPSSQTSNGQLAYANLINQLLDWTLGFFGGLLGRPHLSLEILELFSGQLNGSDGTVTIAAKDNR